MLAGINHLSQYLSPMASILRIVERFMPDTVFLFRNQATVEKQVFISIVFMSIVIVE